MVSPTSSVTSPSPPATCVLPPSPSLSTDIDLLEREDRDKAIRKFLASAELSVVRPDFPGARETRWHANGSRLHSPLHPQTPLACHPSCCSRPKRTRLVGNPSFPLTDTLSQVVRGLRARLSYASYKATHNVSHMPLNDLEAKSCTAPAAPSRLLGTKRKASGTSSNHYNAAAQGSPTRRNVNGPSGALSASFNTAAPRSHYYPTGASTLSHPPHSLYAALLGPPPLKQARTVHNSSDPPVKAPSRSTAGSNARPTHRGTPSAPPVRSIAESTRAQSRSRKELASRTRVKTSKRKQKQAADQAADVEMKAVATLTSLLQSRPSIASASSPHSSLSAASEASFLSLSQYAQSSTRTTTAPSSQLPSAESSFSIPNAARAATPPRSNADNVYSTPRADDEEAANLMLYLHTSPSPVRPSTTRDARDLAAFRALGGGVSLRTKGRVLFSGGDDGRSPLRSESSLTIDTLPCSQSSQNLGQPECLDSTRESAGSLAPAAPMEPNVIPPTPVSAGSPTPSHLIPVPLSPSGQAEGLHAPAPPTPGSVPFNLNDFINVSPSPAASTVPRSAISLKSGLGANLRTDLGRKLFEEEQHRHQHLTGPYNHGDGPRHEKNGGGLGASIDLSTR